jgi:chromosome segregation ATPase
VQALRKDKAAIETKNQELRLTHLRQETKIDQLRKDINELTADNETLCDAYNEVNRANATLRNNYNEVSSINTTLCDNIAALNTNIDQWEKYGLGERPTYKAAFLHRSTRETPGELQCPHRRS